MTVLASTPGPIRRSIASLGGGVLRRGQFILVLAALAQGAVVEALLPSTWRRTVRSELRFILRRAIAGGLPTTLTTAALVGFTMVAQAIYWLGTAGQETLIGPILVTVLVRELTPVLVGLILLGRNGMVAVTELGHLQIGGQVDALRSQGLDPFALLVLPRAVGLAIASFTLGVMFVIAALVIGFLAGRLFGGMQLSLPGFFDQVLQAMNARDFAVFPAKMLGIGLLVGSVACLTGLRAGPDDDAASLLPRGFVRGVLAILLTSLLLSLAI
jgi:phospholipid/cholesterol/gamma-HCH transport system permease protein